MRAPSVLCGAMEIALNRHLAQEPTVLDECAKLNQRGIALHIQHLDWTFFLEFHPQGLRVMPEFTGDVDVRVSGAPSTFFKLLRQVAQNDGGIPPGLRVEGDPELLTRFAKMVARAGFDPEEIIAKYLGDAAGHRVWQGVSSFFQWGRKTTDTLALDTAEYLREETRDLARGTDAREWMDQVDDLRDAVERFEARLSRMERT